MLMHSRKRTSFRPLMGEKSRSPGVQAAHHSFHSKTFQHVFAFAARHCASLGLFPLQLQHVTRSDSLVIGHSGEHCCIAPRKANSLTLPRLGKSAGFELDGTLVTDKFENISSSTSSRTINNCLHARTVAVPLTRQSCAP